MHFIFQGMEMNIPSRSSSTSTSSIFQNMEMNNGSSSMNMSSNISSQGITQIGVMNPPSRPPINITIGGSGSTNGFNGTNSPDAIACC